MAQDGGDCRFGIIEAHAVHQHFYFGPVLNGLFKSVHKHFSGAVVVKDIALHQYFFFGRGNQAAHFRVGAVSVYKGLGAVSQGKALGVHFVAQAQQLQKRFGNFFFYFFFRFARNGKNIRPFVAKRKRFSADAVDAEHDIDNAAHQRRQPHQANPTERTFYVVFAADDMSGYEYLQ